MARDLPVASGRSLTVVLLGLATALALATTWWGTGWHHAAGFPLPYRSMNLPVLWWALYGGGVLLSARLAGSTTSGINRALAEGVLLHLHWALLAIPMQVRLEQYMSRAYQWYVLAAVAGIAAAAAFQAGRRTRALSNGPASPDLPFVFGVVAGLGWAVAHRLWLPAAAGLAGLAAGAAGLDDRVRRGIASRERLPGWVWPAALAALAVVLRLAWYWNLVRQVGVDPSTGFLAASDDGQTYHAMASRVAADPLSLLSRQNPIVKLYFDPAYPLLLGLWYRLTGVHFFAGVVAQSALSAAAVWLIIRIGTELSGGRRSAGLAAGALAAVSQPLVFSSVVYGIEALYLPVLVAWVWAALRLAKDARPGRWIAAAAILGGAILGLRRFGPLLLFALLPWLAWAGRGPKRKLVAYWMAILGIALALYLPIELMYARNGMGRLWHGGSNFQEYWVQPSAFPDVVPGNERLTALGIDPASGLAGSLRAAAGHPVLVVQALADILPKRFACFFFWPPFGAFNTVILLNPLIRNDASPVLEFYATLAVILGVAGTLRRRETRPAAVLLLLIIATQAFIHSVPTYTATIRYSVPIRPFLMVFAACGMVLMRDALRHHSRVS